MYGQGATDKGTIAIGNSATAKGLGGIALGYGSDISSPNRGAIAIGYSAKIAGKYNNQGAIAIGFQAESNRNNVVIGAGAKAVDQSSSSIAIGSTYNDADMRYGASVGRGDIAIGSNAHTHEAYHSLAIGPSIEIKGAENTVIGSGDPSNNGGGKVYGFGNTVIGAQNELVGQTQFLGIIPNSDTALNYVDIANNLVFGSFNKIIGTSQAEAISISSGGFGKITNIDTTGKVHDKNTPAYEGYNKPIGAYRNVIIGSDNILNKNNYRNVALSSNANFKKGSHDNTIIGANVTIAENIGGSYVLGNNVNVTTNNSVYFGDASVATLTPYLITGQSIPYQDETNKIFSNENNQLLEAQGITIGELGQTSTTLTGRTYQFAGQGIAGGGVITVGKLVKVDANGEVHYKTIGRIIQNVAPGLIGAQSTDAVNGSQLYALATSMNKLTAGESGSVINTDENGERLIKENGIFYKQSLITGYRQASNGFWYQNDRFNSSGELIGDQNAGSKRLADLNSELSTETTSYVVAASDLMLSLVNAEKETSTNENQRAEATKTLTKLGNLKASLMVDQSEDELNQKAKMLYEQDNQTHNILDAKTWDKLLSSNNLQDQAIVTRYRIQAMELKAQTAVSNLLTQTNSRTLSQAANMQDLRTLALAGLNFVGNNNNVVLHRPLSSNLNIVGDISSNFDYSKFNAAQDNIYIKGIINGNNYQLTAQISRNLTNLESATFNFNKTGSNMVSLSNAGLNNGGNKITNVAKGQISENSMDAVNGAQLYALWKNTIHIISGSGGATVTQEFPNDMNNTNGTNEENNTTANTIPTIPTNSNTENGNTNNINNDTTVTENTNTNSDTTTTENANINTDSLPTNSFNIHVEQTVAYVDDAGDKLVKVKSKDGKLVFYKEVQTAGKAFNTADGKWYKVENNQLTEVTGEDIPIAVNNDNVLMVAKLVNPKDGSITTPAQLANIASALSVENSNTPVNQQTARTVIAGENQDGRGGLLVKSRTGLNIATNLADLQALAQAGTTFIDDQGTVIHRPIGTALTLRGGATRELSDNNIGVVADGTNTLYIKLAKDLQSMRSITFESGENGQSVKLSQQGLDNGGNRIRNVAPGIENNDAATVEQLRTMNGNFDRRINRLENDLDGVAATAAAMSSLPQSYIPGKSMVAVGAGTHRAQQAVAIGVSRISDNGKIILKLNAGHNTTGNTSVGLGAGFLF